MRERGLLFSLVHSSPKSGGPWAASFAAGFLARVLLEPPSGGLLEALERRPEPPLAVEGLETGIERILASLAAGERLALAREWTRLFVGPRGAPCRPWQDTWQSDGPPRLRGPRHLSALQFWRRLDLEPAHLDTEPADHAGLILAFISALASRAAAEEDVEPLFSEFWAAHVSPWMPRFAATLVAEARDPYHDAIGRLLSECIGVGEMQPEQGKRN